MRYLLDIKYRGGARAAQWPVVIHGPSAGPCGRNSNRDPRHNPNPSSKAFPILLLPCTFYLNCYVHMHFSLFDKDATCAACNMDASHTCSQMYLKLRRIRGRMPKPKASASLRSAAVQVGSSVQSDAARTGLWQKLLSVPRVVILSYRDKPFHPKGPPHTGWKTCPNHKYTSSECKRCI